MTWLARTLEHSVAAMVAALIAGILFIGIDCAEGHRIVVTGVVMRTSYSSTIIAGDYYVPESFNVYIRSSVGEVVLNDEQLFNDVSEGDSVTVRVTRGYFTGHYY